MHSIMRDSSDFPDPTTISPILARVTGLLTVVRDSSHLPNPGSAGVHLDGSSMRLCSQEIKHVGLVYPFLENSWYTVSASGDMSRLSNLLQSPAMTAGARSTVILAADSFALGSMTRR